MKFSLKNTNMRSDSFRILTDTLCRRLRERGCALTEGGYEIRARVDGSLADDRYIVSAEENGISVAAANEAAVFAGVGHFLTECRFDGYGGFRAASLPIDFTPARPLRGMYFATHFHNFYHEAPLEQVDQLIADLAMRGCNVLQVWFDVHEYTGMDDPDAIQMASRLHAMLAFASAIGMKTSLLMLANEGFKSTPEPIKATNDLIGRYFTKPCGFYHTEICPSKEGGMEELLRQRRSILEAFKDIDPDFICLWPYDQGGCTCEKCQPWGINGYMRVLQALKELLSKYCPHTRLILSTWYFDHFVPGEWDGLGELLKQGKLDSFPYIMSFFAGDDLPACLKDDAVRDRIPFIDFPEISMRDCFPWGGCGTNVYGRFLDHTYKVSRNLYKGGFPYSEGCYEDLNKAICLSCYTGMDEGSLSCIRRYVRFEFCTEDEALVNSIADMEETLPRSLEERNGKTYWNIRNTEKTESIYENVCRVHETLPDSIRDGWRWRLIYDRAVLDHEMLKTGGEINGTIRSRACVDDLERIYSSQHSGRYTRPPVLGWKNDSDINPDN